MRPALLAPGVLAAALAASLAAHADVVGTSIGTDLMVDAGYGTSGGYTVINYNDADGTWDEAVRLLDGGDGTVWVVGFHRLDATGDRVAIARLDANGVPDPTYGAGGSLLADTGVGQVRDAVLAGDRFYIAGLHYLDEPGLGVAAIACVMLDGSPCEGFGDGGTRELPLNEPGFNSEAIGVLPRDGALYVVGNTDPGGKFGHSGAIVVAKIDAATGDSDASFGDGSGHLPGSRLYDPELVEGSFDTAYAAAFAADGRLLVGGGAPAPGGMRGFILALDAASGAPDASFGEGGYAWYSMSKGTHYDDLSIQAIRVLDGGRIVAAGNANHDDEFFNMTTGILLVGLEPDGSPTTGFGVDGMIHHDLGINTTVTDLAVRPNGDLVVSTPSNGIAPDPYNSDTLHSILQFDAAGNGPTATVSMVYPSALSPQGWPVSLLVDSADRVLVGGFRMWDFVFPIPDSDHVVTRLVRDRILVDGFDG